MNLPATLAPWASALDLFPRELMSPLAALAGPIDALIGPLRDRRRHGDGEPDGYADIARRGPYERLLLSEWLLAAEEPDEWMRRAVMGEHSFLEISRRKPVADRLAVALFDTGPSQWGSARLAHLAALIVLHRRAQAAGARFAWGILQHAPPPPDSAPWSDVTEAGVLRLTQGIAAREAAPADIAAWRERLAAAANEKPSATPELWIVGGRRLAPFAGRANLLSIATPEDRGEEDNGNRFLTASARFGPDNGSRSVTSDVRLPLPDPGVCVRLLRDPFGVRTHRPAAKDNPAPERPRDSPVSDMLFSLHGSKLFARGAARGGTTLLVYPIGNSPAAGVRTAPKQYRSQFGAPFFAAGRIGGVTATASLTTDGKRVRIETFGKGNSVSSGSYRLSSQAQGTLDADEGAPHAANAAERLMPIVPLYRPDTGGIAELVTVLPDGRLLRLRPVGGQSEGEGIVFGLRCFALCRATNGVMLVGDTGRSISHSLLHDKPLSDGTTLERIEYLTERRTSHVPAGPLTAFLDARGEDGMTFLPQLPDDPTKAAIVFGGERHQVILPQDVKVVGVGHGWPPRTGPLLFLLSVDGGTVWSAPAERPSQMTPLFHAPDTPIARVAVSPYSHLIAFVTETGDVTVWSHDYKDYVYRRVPAEIAALSP